MGGFILLVILPFTILMWLAVGWGRDRSHSYKVAGLGGHGGRSMNRKQKSWIDEEYEEYREEGERLSPWPVIWLSIPLFFLPVIMTISLITLKLLHKLPPPPIHL